MKPVLTAGFATFAWIALAFSGPPVRAETILRLDEVPVGEIDPAKASKSADSILFYNLYDTLLLPGPGGKGFASHLAESYASEGTSFTFKLRRGVKFHSGNEVTADDVVFSLNRLIAIGSGFSPLFRGWVKQAEALDPATVRITLSNVYAPFLAATFRLGVVDKKTVMANLQDGPFGEFKDYGQAWLNRHDAGSGAYRIVAQNPQTETMMEKFPGYFLGIPAKAPDRVQMNYGLEGPTEVALARRGELDVISQWASPETKRTASQIKGTTVVGEVGLAEYVIKLNTKKAPLDDVHCRRAIAFATDYEGLMSQANITPTIRGAKPAKGPLLDGMLGADPSLPDYVRDMDKAKAELAQCKYKPAEQEIEITWIAEVPLEERFALLMQQNWGELGFKTKLTRLPWVSYTQLTTKPETTPHIGQLFYNTRTPDPDGYLYNVYASNATGQYAAAEWLQNPEIDALLDKGRSTIDLAAREKIYREIVLKIRDLQPDIFGYQIINTYAKSDRVGIPALEDPDKNTRIMGLNFLFRQMEMK
jgi:peptide/nickel transport system substrate-binding protein